MKIENEVTGEISERLNNIIRVDIYLRGEKIDDFGIYLNRELISDYLEHNTDRFLGVENTYEGYVQLVKDLGLEIPESYKKHWTPTLKDGTLWCYFVNSVGEIEGNWLSNSTFNNKLVANFNIFPNKELAEEAVNLSKLGRLILLWQYANDCLFTPTWKNNSQGKHFIKHDHINNTISCNFTITAQLDIVYFETSEQVEAFIEMYETEIKKIMGIE